MVKLPVAVDNHWKSLGPTSDPSCHEWQRGHHIDTLAKDSVLQQFRYEKPITFTCVRCGGEKTSKLVAFYGGEQLCNGCYGRLLLMTK